MILQNKHVFILKTLNPYCCKLHVTLNSWTQKTIHHWEIFIMQEYFIILEIWGGGDLSFLYFLSCSLTWKFWFISFILLSLNNSEEIFCPFLLTTKKTMQLFLLQKFQWPFSSIFSFCVTDIFQPQHSGFPMCPSLRCWEASSSGCSVLPLPREWGPRCSASVHRWLF